MGFGPLEDETLRHGALVGAIAFAAGAFIIIPLVLAGGGPLGDQLFEKPVASLVLAYMLFHGWPIFFGGPLQALALALLPVFLLMTAGYITARRTTGFETPAHYRGAAVVFGYLPMTGLGYIYGSLRFGLDAGGNIGEFFGGASLPIVITSVGYTGLLFPVAFGAVGGALYAFWTEDEPP